MEESLPILQCEGFAASYLRKMVFDEINLSIRQHETVLLTGPNGCGKSTLLKALLGLAPHSFGNVFFCGEDISKLKTPERVKLGIGYAPQYQGLFYGMTVEENLNLVIDNFNNVKKQELAEIFEQFPLIKRLLKHKAGTLSGGEQKIVTIAATFLSGARLLLIDEPLLGLAGESGETVMRKIKELKDEKVSMLIVEHKISTIRGLCDRLVEMKNGKIQPSNVQN